MKYSKFWYRSKNKFTCSAEVQQVARENKVISIGQSPVVMTFFYVFFGYKPVFQKAINLNNPIECGSISYRIVTKHVTKIGKP